MYRTCAFCEVALLRWERYDFVRVGRPPRVELAGWRYGQRLRARERERAKVVVPLTVAAVGVVVALNVAAGGSFGFLAWNFARVADGAYVALVGNRRVTLTEPPICAACGSVMQLRARHLKHGRLVKETHAELALLVRCPSCGAEGALLTGPDAAQALRRGLTYLNASRGARRRAELAAREVDLVGGPERLIQDVSRRELTLRSLRPERRVALEMAEDEVDEITELERRWKEAEEIAEIAEAALAQGPRARGSELPRPQAVDARAEAAHGVRGSALPERRGVLGAPRGHLHDSGRRVHPELRVLRRGARDAWAARPRGAGAPRRRRRANGAAARRDHERRPDD